MIRNVDADRMVRLGDILDIIDEQTRPMGFKDEDRTARIVREDIYQAIEREVLP